MTHQIYQDRAMMYVGEMPWHKLGIRLEHNATWEKAKSTVGFYTVEKKPLLVSLGESCTDMVEVQDRMALTRADTGEYLAVVGRGYGIVQFDDMAEAVMRACGGQAVFHTAGLLGTRGTRGWLLGEIGEPIKVKGDSSEIRKYFLATTAHDGATSVELLNAATRVVCANTLGVALGERDGARWSVRHTTNAADRVKAAGEAFSNLVRGYDNFAELANLLAQVRLSNKQMQATVDTVLPLPGEDKAPSKQLQNKRETVTSLFETARGIEGIRGTAWGAFQAWTQFADHHLVANRDAQSRLDSIWFGQAADMKKKALRAIQTQVQLQAA